MPDNTAALPERRMNGGLTARSGTRLQDRFQQIKEEHHATDASALGARQASTRASKHRRGLPPRLEEDVRLIGALAELFAAAAAERLMDTDTALDATLPTLPLIA